MSESKSIETVFCIQYQKFKNPSLADLLFESQIKLDYMELYYTNITSILQFHGFEMCFMYLYIIYLRNIEIDYICIFWW